MIDSALVKQVLEQAPHGIVGDGGDDGRIEAKAALQPASNVVFAAAFRHGECSRRSNAVIARIKAQHHLAQTDQVPAVPVFGLMVSGIVISRVLCSFSSLNPRRLHPRRKQMDERSAIRYTEPAMMNMGT